MNGIPNDVRLGEVSEEVREELARLFGAPAGSMGLGDESVDDDPDDSAGPEPIDPTGASGGVREPADDGASSPTGGGAVVAHEPESAAAARAVVPIGDPSSDTVAPLPIDPLVPVAPQSGVVQIVDDGTLPTVREAGDVSRVLIVDDDSPAPRSPDRDRRRKRRAGLRGVKVKWLRLGAIGTAAFVVIAAILASPIFAIRTVVFDGAVYTSTESIDEVREMLDGSSVFTADTDLARQRMLEDPWVAEVRITTDFPGRAVVEVAERVPVVWYVADDQKARVIDARGHVIAVLEGWPTKYLQVRGTGPALEAGATADEAYRAAAQLVLALPDEISGKVEALELSPGGELSMFLTGGTTVRFGPPEGLQDKLVAVVVLMRRQDPATLAVVDVSTGEPTVQTR